MRTPPAVLAAIVLAALACAPILPPPLPATPQPEVAHESPSPGGIWSPFDPIAESDVAALKSAGILIPVRGVPLAKIEDSFDAPREGGRRHDAVDILAPRGTPVLAATDGTVLRAGVNALGGNVIWMTDAERRFVYYYAHLDRYARGVQSGAWIARGTPIGYVGTTGNAPPDVPHLHFQVMRMTDTVKWWNGTPVNPVPFLVEPAVPAAPRQSR